MKKKAFTLIELLVVVAIIAILAVIVFLNLSSARPKARDARRRNDVATIQTALELYLDQEGQFWGSGPQALTYSSVGGGWSTLTNQLTSKGIVKSLPKDPLNNTSYRYDVAISPGGTDYEVNCVLEKDSSAMADDGGNNLQRYEVGSNLNLIQ